MTHNILFLFVGGGCLQFIDPTFLRTDPGHGLTEMHENFPSFATGTFGSRANKKRYLKISTFPFLIFRNIKTSKE